jgi:SAM-dependent methyltransferase
MSLVLNSDPVLIEEHFMRFWALPKNDRFYHAWHPGKYPFPCDIIARDGDNLLNGVIYEYCLYNRDGLPVQGGVQPLENLRMMPLTGVQYPNKVLDLGCGNGSWVTDVATMFRNATVVGVDLVGCQDMLSEILDDTGLVCGTDSCWDQAATECRLPRTDSGK